MQVEQIKTEKKFTPIDLKITIESEEELCDLFHRLNLASNVVNDHESTILKYNSSYKFDELFHVISGLVTENNLKI